MKSFQISADYLKQLSRNFYERVRMKVVASIILGAAAMLSLAFCTAVGGWSASTYSSKEQLPTSTDDKVLNAYQSLVSGWGFASFMYILAFVVFSIVAIYASPICCGSSNEWRMVKGPTEIFVKDDSIPDEEDEELMGSRSHSEEGRAASATSSSTRNLNN